MALTQLPPSGLDSTKDFSSLVPSVFRQANAAFAKANTVGAIGGSNNMIFFENDTILTANYTISAGRNAGSFGPISINAGIEITVPANSVWTIV